MTMPELEEKLQRHLLYLQQDPQNVNIILSIVDCYHKLGNANLAHRYLHEALALLPQEYDFKNVDELLVKARILLYLEQYEEALLFVESMVKQHPSETKITGLLGLLYFDNNDIERAHILSKQTLERDKENKDAQLVQLLLKALHNEADPLEIKKLLTIMPAEFRLWFALGATEMRFMNIEGASFAFFKATQYCPNFYDSWISLGFCYLLQNDLDKAWDAYQKSVKIDAECADGWGGLTLISALQGKITEAEKFLEETRVLESNNFLLSIAEIIIANQLNPKYAAQLLDISLPEVAQEIKRMLSNVILIASMGERVIH